MSKVKVGFGLFIGFLLLVPALVAFLSYLFMIMWNFAVVEAFDFANPIDYPVAFVLMLFISFFVGATKRG